MTKRLGIISLAGLLFLTGCLPAMDRSEEEVIVVDEEEEDEVEYVITPTIETPENFYRNVLRDGQYHRSPTRGNVSYSMSNRVDIDQFEVGLMEIASASFSQDDYYFQEGQILGSNEVKAWLGRESEDNELGLNPALGDEEDQVDRLRNSPSIISHLMEHNYMYEDGEDGVKLGGIVIGIGLRTIYYFRDDDYTGYEVPLDDDVVEAYGKEAAEKILSRMRGKEGLEDVPITIALYQEEKRNSIVPGSYIAMAESNGDQLGNWEQINDQYYFFPSNQATENNRDHADSFNQFKQDVDDFFGRSIGIVGKARYKSGSIEELKIDVNLQSHGKAEIIALTQYVSGRIEQHFNIDAPVTVNLESVNGTEALVVKYPGQDEPFVHVY
ncbi:CamS family sex pheromone protein [Alteribacter keqinensis]|uniref:CamS family sex pheromone protein n=1 Tax=Alteribacter keqinensis TaxID=2483800 RepID=A0A3M7TNN6_9BACI|nr:CamS family sex pheromone protein [Alteribacter keqinensis]RNA66736.1 CamS family sex pheromone protein [Alteribacter keqinensis]